MSKGTPYPKLQASILQEYNKWLSPTFTTVGASPTQLTAHTKIKTLLRVPLPPSKIVTWKDALFLLVSIPLTPTPLHPLVATEKENSIEFFPSLSREPRLINSIMLGQTVLSFTWCEVCMAMYWGPRGASFLCEQWHHGVIIFSNSE